MILSLLLVGCIWRSDHTELIDDYRYGDYRVKIQRKSIAGWEHSSVIMPVEVKYKRQPLDSHWLSDQLNLFLPGGGDGNFLYLEGSRKILIFYRGLDDQSFLVATIDTSKSDLNFLPIKGNSTFWGSQRAISELVSKDARSNGGRVFWNVPDETAKNYSCCKMKYYKNWNIFFSEAVYVDGHSGEAFPRNDFTKRYRFNSPMVPEYRAWPDHDLQHPASEEIRKIPRRQSREDYDIHTDVVLGVTPERAAVWYANFTSDFTKTRVCLEKFSGDGWQCIAFNTADFPDHLKKSFLRSGRYPPFRCAPSQIDYELDEPAITLPSVRQMGNEKFAKFEVRGVGVGYGAVKCVSDGEVEAEISQWIQQYVSLVQKDGDWALQASPKTRVLDAVRIGKSKT